MQRQQGRDAEALETYQTALKLSRELTQMLKKAEGVDTEEDLKPRELGFYLIHFKSDLLEPTDDDLINTFYDES